MEEEKKSALRRFLQYIKPYWFNIFLVAFFGILKFQIPLIFPWAFKEIIDKVLLSNKDNVFKLQTLNYYCSLLIIVALVYGVVTFFRHYIHARVSSRIIFDIRYKLFLHIQKMSLSFFEKRQIGQIVSNVINDINLASNFVGSAVTNTIMDSVSIVTISYILFKMNWKLALVSMTILPFYMWSIMSFRPKIRKVSKEAQRKLAILSGDLHERLAGVKIVQAFTREKTETIRFFHDSREYYDMVVEGANLNARLQTISEMFARISPIIVLWYGGYLVLGSKLTVGELIAFYAYLGSFYFPFTRFAELNVIIQNSVAAMERIFEVFDTKPEIVERKGALDIKITRGEVIFKNVNFGYTAEKLVLKNINILARPGEKIALVGPSGAGKTTLVNLLLRFYDVNSGAILIDGIDIRDFTLKSLRKQIGIVTQEPILFTGTIEENIKYGNVEARYKDIVDAAKAANAYDFIMGFPNKFKEKIGEKGATLSGGQRQRIAIARVFLKNPKIIILDEATASLDSISEELVQESLEELLKGRTTFIIAHRLSTVLNADKIVVLDKGEVVQFGTHNELISQSGSLYERLYNEQFKVQEEAK